MHLDKDKRRFYKDKMHLDKDKRRLDKDKMHLDKDKMRLDKDKTRLYKDKMELYFVDITCPPDRRLESLASGSSGLDEIENPEMMSWSYCAHRSDLEGR
jgi:hypothetical protein